MGSGVTEMLRGALFKDLHSLDQRSERERRSLTTQLRNLRQERYLWAEKAMNGAVPDDIAQEKQASLSKQISHAEGRLATMQIAAVDVQMTIETCLELAERCAVAYKLASPQGRRDWNQAWWDWLEVDREDDGDPVVRRGKRTPLLEAIMTAEPTDPHVNGQNQGHRPKEAGVFSLSVMVRESKLWCGRECPSSPPSGHHVSGLSGQLLGLDLWT